MYNRIVVPSFDDPTPTLNNNVQEMIILIDWVSVTFPHETDYRIAFSILGIPESEFKPLERGMNGYKKQLRCGKHIIVLYDGTDQMGTHVILTGQGCREYEQRMMRENAQVQDFELWKEFIRVVFDHRGKFTRLDLAIDDHLPHFTVEQIYRKIKENLVNSKFDGYKMIESGKIRQDVTGDSNAGMTVYFGSDYSNTQIVFYNKKEQIKKEGKEVKKEYKAWNRVEVRLFDENTHAATIHILHANDLGRVAKGILHNYIEILEESQTDKNRARWRYWRNWQKFLGDVDKLRLHHVAPDRSIEKSLDWIDRQVKKTIAKIFVAMKGDLRIIQKWVEEGSQQFDSDDLYDIDVYQTKQQFFNFVKDMPAESEEKMLEMMMKRLEIMKIEHDQKKGKKISLVEGTTKPILE